MSCKICDGKGFTNKQEGMYEIVVECQCRRQERVIDELETSGIPSKYQRFTLSRKATDGRRPFKPGGEFYARGLSKPDADRLRHCKSSQSKALNVCRDRLDTYIDAFTKQLPAEIPGILLSGTCGVGKTHLAATLLTDLVYAGITPVRFTEYTQLFRKLRYSYSTKDVSEEQILETLVRAKVLVLDDLGAQASDNTTWVQDILGYLLNERYSNMRPTIITTNYPDDDSEDANGLPAKGPFLVDRVGVRLRSRIREMCPRVSMHGFDLRNLMESSKTHTGPRHG